MAMLGRLRAIRAPVVVFWVVAPLVVAATAYSISMAYYFEPSFGKPLSEADAGVRLTLDAHWELVRLGVLGFGLIGFLATYQQKSGGSMPKNGWITIATGAVLFAGATAHALTGIEVIISMAAKNLVRLDWWFLRMCRTLMYLLFFLGIVSISCFGIEVFAGSGFRAVRPRAGEKSAKQE